MSTEVRQNCQAWEELVYLYTEAGTSPEEAAAVAAHLDACSGCRRLAEELRELQAAVSGLREPSPPPEFLSGLQGRLAQERPGWRMAREAESRRTWRQSWQVTAAAAGLGVALFLAWVCGQSYGEGISGAQAWSSLHGMVQATAEEYQAAAASARQLPARAPGWWSQTQAWTDDAARGVIQTLGLVIYGPKSISW
jgi:predicted anti-sigma-YlaC factor YlaD